MARKRLLWQLYPSYLLVAVTATVSVGWYAAHLLEKSYLDSLRDRLTLATRLVEQEIGISLGRHDADSLRAACGEAAAITASNVAVLVPSGDVVAESGQAASFPLLPAPCKDAAVSSLISDADRTTPPSI